MAAADKYRRGVDSVVVTVEQLPYDTPRRNRLGGRDLELASDLVPLRAPGGVRIIDTPEARGSIQNVEATERGKNRMGHEAGLSVTKQLSGWVL